MKRPITRRRGRAASFAASRSLACLPLVGVLALTGCGSEEGMATAPRVDPAMLDQQIAPGETVLLTVWGMSCPKCINNVDQLLADVPGVRGSSTNMALGLVTVETGDPAPSSAALKAAIDEAGFTLMSLEVAEDRP